MAQVSVSAELVTEHDGSRGKRTESVARHLEIGLHGGPSVTGNLRVVTVIFARKYPGREIVEKRSEKTVTLDASHKAELVSATERLTLTEEHEVRVERKGGNRKRNSPPQYRTIPAKGEKYAGWAVRVFQGKTLLGEEASAQQYKLDP